MERTLLLGIGMWVSGAGAWVVGAGYMLAPFVARQATGAPRIAGPDSIRCELEPRDSDTSSELLANTVDVDDAGLMETEVVSSDETLRLRRPEDPSDLLTESQRRRLAPVNPLKRKRRSRKVRVMTGGRADKFVPLVSGARASTEEAILASYAGETLNQRQEAGEDFWVDPQLYKKDVDRKRQDESRRKMFKRKGSNFAPEKLREEIAAPYKNNVIGLTVIAVGVIAVFFSLFPGLLENNVATSIASFPESL
ncbi:hypothetical protein AB1Y20_007545 [Prymnesium parvum]|uniref:Transmembrane protein n=1 Tax=Prymnesium parvum TaxID=97485 RepID=A0AB34IV65_PRYPA